MSALAKMCSECGAFKSLDEFYYRADRQKHRDQCKDCVARKPGAQRQKRRKLTADERATVPVLLVDREHHRMQRIDVPKRFAHDKQLPHDERFFDAWVAHYQRAGCVVVELDMAESEAAK